MSSDRPDSEVDEILKSDQLIGLHRELIKILRAELRAGNSIREIGMDWPEPGGILVRLKKPFQVAHDPLPAEIQFAQINDPHWWIAEYFSLLPRHALAG